MYVCIYVCMYVCMYICMYVCMHACIRGMLGFTVLRFWPFFTSVFLSFSFWSLVLWFSKAPWFTVVSPYRRWFMVCRCCSWFFGSFITLTLHAPLEHYTDIAVSVFSDFGHGFAVFGAFCCGFVVFASPLETPLYVCMFVCIINNMYFNN